MVQYSHLCVFKKLPQNNRMGKDWKHQPREALLELLQAREIRGGIMMEAEGWERKSHEEDSAFDLIGSVKEE